MDAFFSIYFLIYVFFTHSSLKIDVTHHEFLFPLCIAICADWLMLRAFFSYFFVLPPWIMYYIGNISLWLAFHGTLALSFSLSTNLFGTRCAGLIFCVLCVFSFFRSNRSVVCLPYCLDLYFLNLLLWIFNIMCGTSGACSCSLFHCCRMPSKRLRYAMLWF